GNPPANYEYRAVACNLFGCGPDSGVVTTEVGPPTAAPTLTAPTSSTTGNYTVSWTSVPRADNYKLEQSFNNGAWSSQTLAGTSRVYANQPFGSYRYRVCGLRVSCGPYSAIKTVTVAPLPPDVPALTVPALDPDG